jgi:hypothetical protein
MCPFSNVLTLAAGTSSAAEKKEEKVTRSTDDTWLRMRRVTGWTAEALPSPGRITLRAVDFARRTLQCRSGCDEGMRVVAPASDPGQLRQRMTTSLVPG